MEVMIVDYMSDSGHWTKLSYHKNKQNKESKGLCYTTDYCCYSTWAGLCMLSDRPIWATLREANFMW
jgi:hypothetical protein